MVQRSNWLVLAIAAGFLVALPRARGQDLDLGMGNAEQETPPEDESSEMDGGEEPSTEPEATPSVEPPPSGEATSEADAEADVREAEGESDGEQDVEEEVSGGDWLDSLTFRVFADAFFAAHWTLPSGFSGDHSAVLPHRAYDVNGGLNLAFAGLDLRYAPDPIGAAIDLRFGSAVPRLLGAFSGLPEGLQFVKQAYVSWRPDPMIQIDFGQFDTIYGAEVSESWLNPNYTRGALYNVVQPFYHGGFRVIVTPLEGLTLTGILVNGWNNVLDNNDGKTGGVMARYAVGPLSASIGYLVGPEKSPDDTTPGDEDARLRHFVDAVIGLDLGDFDLISNGDLVVEDIGNGDTFTLWGVMLGARYQLIDELALAARVEYIGLPDLPEDAGRDLWTTTFTLDVQPASQLIIRLDIRTDVASDDRFIDTDGDPTEVAFSAVLGVVVHSD